MTIQGPGTSAIALDGAKQYRLLYIDSNGRQVTISGLTIQNGIGGGKANGGGGVYVATGTVSLLSCTVFGNTSSYAAGILNYGTLTLMDCLVDGNSSSVRVGGIENDGTIALSYCTVSNNSNTGGEYDGGGIINQGVANINNCLFYNNNAANSGWGGAIANENGGRLALINDIFLNNSSGSRGGGFYNNSIASMTNCTFTQNSAASAGGGIYTDKQGTTYAENCILYGDTAGIGAEFAGPGSLTATFSDIQGGTTGNGNINANPLFVNGLTQPFDLHLLYNSPCLGAGTTTNAPTTTYDGLTRPNPPSIGAYEVEPTVLLKSSLNPSYAKQSVTFTATANATPTPTGAVTFTVDGKSLATVTLSKSGTATYTTATLSAGTHTVIASYNGNSLFPASSSAPLTQTVIAGPTVTGVSPGSGPLAGGTAVTITGTGFVIGSTVMFGTLAATSIKIASATSITCTSPAASAGAVHVRVTTPGGTSPTSSSDAFTYNAVPTVAGISPTAGPLAGGTLVTITGTGFVPGATVNFGTIAATVVALAANTIVCKSPAEAAGTVNVTVTTPGGTSTTSSADNFTYDALVTVTQVSPNTGVPAGGTLVAINGTGFVNGATVKFGSAVATNVTVVNSTSITCTSPAGTGAVNITVTTPGGTSPVVPQDKFTYAVPVLNSFSFNPATISAGSSTVATVTLTGPAPAGGVAVTITTGLFGYDVIIPAGASSASITLHSAPGIPAGAYPFTAAYGKQSLTATLTVK